MNPLSYKANLVFSLGLFFVSHQLNAKFFATMAVSEQEFLGCRDRHQDHKCLPVIAIGCRTLCREDYDELSPLKAACVNLCHNKNSSLKVHKISRELPFQSGERSAALVKEAR